MNRVDFHFKEFDALHAEANRYVREQFALERYAVAGTVAVYAWLLANNTSNVPMIAWYIPLIFTILGVVRSLSIGYQLKCLSDYLRHIEMSGGWEGHWRRRRGPWLIIASAAIFWILVLGIQIFAICYLADRAMVNV